MKPLKAAAWVASGSVVLLIALTVAAVIWIHVIKPPSPVQLPSEKGAATPSMKPGSEFEEAAEAKPLPSDTALNPPVPPEGAADAGQPQAR